MEKEKFKWILNLIKLNLGKKGELKIINKAQMILLLHSNINILEDLLLDYIILLLMMK